MVSGLILCKKNRLSMNLKGNSADITRKWIRENIKLLSEGALYESKQDLLLDSIMYTSYLKLISLPILIIMDLSLIFQVNSFTWITLWDQNSMYLRARKLLWISA